MAAIRTFYLSRILDTPLYSEIGLKLGRIKDVLVDVGAVRPRVVAIRVHTAKGPVLLDYAKFRVEKEKGRYSLVCSEPVPFVHDETCCILLRRTMMDKQIVDIDGRKVERVNDLRLAVLEDGTFLVAVDVGMEGLLRRLGVARPVGRLLRPFHIAVPNHLILWDEVQTVDAGNAGLRLSSRASSIGRLHPSDVADIIDSLDRNAQIAVFASLDQEKAADVLEELEPETQATLLSNLPLEHAADLLEAMPSDEVADILDGLNDEKAEALLNEMEDEASDEVRELMEYEDGTVGSVMSKDYFAFNEYQTVEDVFETLRRIRPESDSIYYLYILDNAGVLIATVSLRDLIVSDPLTRLSAVMNEKVQSVLDTDRIEAIVEIIDKYNLLAVPVVDDQKKLSGVVIINDVVYGLMRARRRR